jgi:hypothetical protein
MDFISLTEMITEAKNKKKRKIDLFGTENFRSWMLYFVPGDGTVCITTPIRKRF